MIVKDDIPALSWNLRYLASREEKDPTNWAQQVSKRTRNFIKEERVKELLEGSKHSDQELRVLIDHYGIEKEQLLSGQLYEEDIELSKSNIIFLVDLLPDRENQIWADELGVKPQQLSRWKKGEISPQSKNIKKLLRLHGLESELDLKTVPLFLMLEPISAFKKKEWVKKRLEKMKPSEVAKIFTALKRLLVENEKD